jgi:hypothetical protein
MEEEGRENYKLQTQLKRPMNKDRERRKTMGSASGQNNGEVGDRENTGI